MRAEPARIGVFMPGLAGGGAERAMLNVSEELARVGLEVDVVVARRRGELAQYVPEGVSLVDLGASRIVASLGPLMRYLRRREPKALLATLAPTNCVAVWARMLARRSPRLVLSEQNTLTMSSAGSGNRRARLFPLLMRWSYPLADEIVAVSNGVARDLSTAIGLPEDRIHVIHNPVFTEEMMRLSREPVDHPWFVKDAPPVILGVGRLTRQKDFPLLVRAFHKMRESRPARLIVLGEGEERSRIERLVGELALEESVSLPGFVPNPYAYMRNANVLVLSSRWEGFGNVLVEALGCGAAIVSTDCPTGPREILQDGRWGRLVPVGDVAAMADAILRALCQRPELCELERRASAFSPAPIVRSYRLLMRV